VIGLIKAFQQGLHLRLRPDDVWLAILTQFRIYCDTYPDAVPGLGVREDVGLWPKIRISSTVFSDSTRSIMDHLNSQLAPLINQTPMFSTFKHWVEPCFSTTTATDKAVASVVTMGRIRNNVDQYRFPTYVHPKDGLAYITLLGTLVDWNLILSRINKLSEYKVSATDAALTSWIKQLTEVLRGITASFSLLNEQATKDFWARACLFDGIDSVGFAPLDKETMNGWITAFCFWSWGGCLNAKYDALAQCKKPARQELFREDDLYATTFSARQKLVLNGVEYHHVFPGNIPNAVACLPIDLLWHIPKNDNIYDKKHDKDELTMVAGLVGATVSKGDEAGEKTFVEPRAGWWMLKDEQFPISPVPE
jgi:hypothetical protein